MKYGNLAFGLVGVLTGLIGEGVFARYVSPTGHSTDATKLPELELPKSVDRVTVDVDYAASLKTMIEAGRYDETNPDITDEHFSIEDSGKVEVTIELVRYSQSRFISTEEVLYDLDALGLRPATLEELLALGATRPDLQRKYPIIALGSGWQDPLCWISRSPCLTITAQSGRALILDRTDSLWIGGIPRFAAVRK